MNLKTTKMSEKLHDYVQEKFKNKEFYWDSDTIEYFKTEINRDVKGSITARYWSLLKTIVT